MLGLSAICATVRTLTFTMKHINYCITDTFVCCQSGDDHILAAFHSLYCQNILKNK